MAAAILKISEMVRGEEREEPSARGKGEERERVCRFWRKRDRGVWIKKWVGGGVLNRYIFNKEYLIFFDNFKGCY